LSFLIAIAFFGIIYGMYIKITSKSSENYDLSKNISLLLKKDQEIKNMQVIDNNNILITIGNEKEIKGIIYDTKNKKILQTISK